MREWHIRCWQIWHWKLLVVSGRPDFRRSRFVSNSWTRRALKSCIILICAWLASLFCHLLTFPAEKVWYHRPSVVYTVYPDAKSHEVAVDKTTAWGCMCHPCKGHAHTIAVVQSVETPLFHWYSVFWLRQYSYMFLPLDVSNFSETAHMSRKLTLW